MRARHPGCLIVGARDGYFAHEDEMQVALDIRNTRPDIVFVALGIPKQEKWIANYRDVVGARVLIGVGGSFDVHSGRVKRAPAWMQSLNLEWLYRLVKNPHKIGKVMTLPKFVLMTLRDKRH